MFSHQNFERKADNAMVAKTKKLTWAERYKAAVDAGDHAGAMALLKERGDWSSAKIGIVIGVSIATLILVIVVSYNCGAIAARGNTVGKDEVARNDIKDLKEILSAASSRFDPLEAKYDDTGKLRVQFTPDILGVQPAGRPTIDDIAGLKDQLASSVKEGQGDAAVLRRGELGTELAKIRTEIVSAVKAVQGTNSPPLPADDLRKLKEAIAKNKAAREALGKP